MNTIETLNKLAEELNKLPMPELPALNVNNIQDKYKHLFGSEALAKIAPQIKATITHRYTGDGKTEYALGLYLSETYNTPEEEEGVARGLALAVDAIAHECDVWGHLAPLSTMEIGLPDAKRVMFIFLLVNSNHLPIAQYLAGPLSKAEGEIF